MGKAVIISEYGAGKYRIAEEFETSRALAEIAELEAQNTTIDARLDTLTEEINSAILAVYYAAEVLRAAIVNQETEAEKREKQTQHLSAKQTLDALQATETYLGLKKAANRKKKEYLEEKTAQPAQVDAWCCDYTEGITGSVGTVELGRERTAPIIQPGGAATFSASRDGQMQPLSSSTADAVFYNAAIQAGATKWRPRFRTGTASNINTTADTMTVALTPLVIDGVDCNQSTILTNVQVTYLTCNASAFSDGDSVVVEFTGQDWGQPKIVGFVDNPQPCEDCPELFLDGPLVGIVGSIYEATEGVPPYTYSIDYGEIDEATGEIVAVPACSGGTYGIEAIVTAEDSCVPTQQVNLPIQFGTNYQSILYDSPNNFTFPGAVMQIIADKWVDHLTFYRVRYIAHSNQVWCAFYNWPIGTTEDPCTRQTSQEVLDQRSALVADAPFNVPTCVPCISTNDFISSYLGDFDITTVNGSPDDAVRYNIGINAVSCVKHYCSGYPAPPSPF